MQNFTYYNPTELIFGRDAQLMVGQKLLPWAQANKRVMLVFGGGSVVRSGLLAQVMKSCEEAGLTVVLKGGVKPNPSIEFVREAIRVAREEKVDAILAVGGGSVIDAAKATAMGVDYDGDVWDFYETRTAPDHALPVVAVLTIPAAGSEQSVRSVITNGDKKCGTGNNVIRPKVAIINPELFFTLPQKQIAAGVIDMMSHIMERYFTLTPAVDYTTEQAEAALRVIMANGLKLVENPQDYDAWSQVGLAGSFAHNGYFGLGHLEDWACHGIEHALSGWNTDITHGEGLAVVTPGWMQYVWDACPERFVRFMTKVMGVTHNGNDEETIKLGIAKFTAFLIQMGLPTHLSQLTEQEVPIANIAQLATKNGSITLGNFKPLRASDVEAILGSVR